MPNKSKQYRADLEKVDRARAYPLDEAVGIVKSFHSPKFDQSVELCMHLGVDPKQADQIVRGSVSLPHGIGKAKRVIAFCTPDKVDAAKEAGAVEAGGEELVKKIEDGWMEFDVAIAEPPMMRFVGKLGKLLGPRGLMPSPKAGTVTPDVADAVKDYAAGKLEFRTDAGGNVHVIIGKQSFEPKQLVENAEHFVGLIRKMRPLSAKGQYVKKISLSATMTPGVMVEA